LPCRRHYLSVWLGDRQPCAAAIYPSADQGLGVEFARSKVADDTVGNTVKTVTGFHHSGVEGVKDALIRVVLADIHLENTPVLGNYKPVPLSGGRSSIDAIISFRIPLGHHPALATASGAAIPVGVGGPMAVVSLGELLANVGEITQRNRGEVGEGKLKK
jgi:hypothetical protein